MFLHDLLVAALFEITVTLDLPQYTLNYDRVTPDYHFTLPLLIWVMIAVVLLAVRVSERVVERMRQDSFMPPVKLVFSSRTYISTFVSSAIFYWLKHSLLQSTTSSSELTEIGAIALLKKMCADNSGLPNGCPTGQQLNINKSSINGK